jgi:hypothetical protein
MVSINSSTGAVQPNNRTSLNSTNQNKGQGIEHNVAEKAGVDGRFATSSIKSTDQSQTASAVQSSDNRSVVATSNSKNAVASAVALSVKAMKNADYQQSQVQYDLPEGRSRKALQEYFNVMSHDKREELSQMLGVDMYV